MAKSGVKFKDTMAAYDRLRGEIAGRKFAPVYLLMGEEAFFIDALCDLLASTILQESERAFNQLTVYGRDSDAGQVVNLCRQMPMMGSYQVVILKEAQQLRGLDKLSLYTSKPSPTTILIVCHKEKNVDKRSQLYKASPSTVRCSNRSGRATTRSAPGSRSSSPRKAARSTRKPRRC